MGHTILGYVDEENDITISGNLPSGTYTIKYENGVIADGKYIASFIGFAPYQDPEYVVYVIVNEPKGAYYGGVVAAPLAGKIFEEIFKIKDKLNDALSTLNKPIFKGAYLAVSPEYIPEANWIVGFFDNEASLSYDFCENKEEAKVCYIKKFKPYKLF